MLHPHKKNIKPRRKRLLVWLTLLALLLSLAFVLLVPLIREAFPGQKISYEIKQPTVRTLESRPAEEIDRVTIFPDGENSYTLHMVEGMLMLENGGVLTPVDELYQQDILDMLTHISVQYTVAEDAAEAEEHWEAMGLKEPRCKASVRYRDGSEETMEVGEAVHGSGEYYFRWSGAPGIYLCHAGVPDLLSTQEKILLPFEEVNIIGSLVDTLEIRNQNGECAFSFRAGTSGDLTAPCRYPLTDDTAQTLLSALSNFRLGASEAPLTDENSEAYGFHDPLCELRIVQRAGVTNVITNEGALATAETPAQTLQFVVGRAEGEFFYTCAYQGQIYLISRFLVETLVQADWKNLISRTPAAIGSGMLSDIVFETPEATVEVHVERTESVLENNQLEVDADGNIVYLTSVTVNGEPAPQEKLEVLLDSLNAFTVEGSLPEGAAVAEEPSWRITLVTEQGEIRVLEGFRLDVFSDSVAVNGVMCHYVYNEAIDVLMTGLV